MIFCLNPHGITVISPQIQHTNHESSSFYYLSTRTSTEPRNCLSTAGPPCPKRPKPAKRTRWPPRHCRISVWQSQMTAAVIWMDVGICHTWIRKFQNSKIPHRNSGIPRKWNLPYHLKAIPKFLKIPKNSSGIPHLLNGSLCGLPHRAGTKVACGFFGIFLFKKRNFLKF